MPAVVLGWWAIVSMLDQTGEGIAGIAGIDPVAVGHLAVQRENEALRAVCLAPVVTDAVIIWQGGYEATGQARRHGGNDAVKRPCPGAGAYLPASIIERLRIFDARSQQHLAACLADAFDQAVIEQLEAAAQVAEVGGAVVEARPEPG